MKLAYTTSYFKGPHDITRLKINKIKKKKKKLQRDLKTGGGRKEGLRMVLHSLDKVWNELWLQREESVNMIQYVV